MAIVALDIGLKRIGVALSPDGKIALPLQAVLRKNRNQAAKDTASLIEMYGAKRVVVGVPLGGASQEAMHRRVEHFVGLLKEHIADVEISYQDESDTSKEAKELLKGKIRQVRDGRIDSLAAMLILERYLNSI